MASSPVVMPPDANIPYEWQTGSDNGKLCIIVPSWSQTDKTSYLVMMDKKTRVLRCECKGFEMNGVCRHVRGLKWFCARPEFRKKGHQPTSFEAWTAIQNALADNQRMVFDALRKLRRASNKELSNGLGWPINCITPRVLELREMGLVEASGTQVNRAGRREIVWSVA